MKIAILTLPLNLNYGGIMQNYALQSVLSNMGHEVYTINLTIPDAHLPFYKKPIAYSWRFIRKIWNRKSIVLWEQKINSDRKIIGSNIKKFIQENITLTKEYPVDKKNNEFDKEQFDIVIVGSDQVWRIPYTYNRIKIFFLDFIYDKRIKKIAYSVSFGTDEIEFSNELIRECGQLLKDFDLVTTREEYGVKMINNFYKWKCKDGPYNTLDPTLLLSKHNYLQLIPQYLRKNKKGIFYYILDMTNEKQDIVNKIESEMGIGIFTMKNMNSKSFDNIANRILPPIEEWLAAFENAEFVFTDSFHGCVFSIIFNKPFIVFANKNRGLSRFTSILSKFNLQDRIIYDIESFNTKLLKTKIEWDEVNNILEIEKQKSLEILTKHINHI